MLINYLIVTLTSSATSITNTSRKSVCKGFLNSSSFVYLNYSMFPLKNTFAIKAIIIFYKSRKLVLMNVNYYTWPPFQFRTRTLNAKQIPNKFVSIITAFIPRYDFYTHPELFTERFGVLTRWCWKSEVDEPADPNILLRVWEVVSVGLSRHFFQRLIAK